MSGEIKVLRLPEVLHKVGLKQSAVYKHIKLGSFPKPIKLGARSNGWLESDIDQWILSRPGRMPANDDHKEHAA